jgi:hypothetical protein
MDLVSLVNAVSAVVFAVAVTLLALCLALWLVWAMLRLTNMMLRDEHSRKRALTIITSIVMIPQLVLLAAVCVWAHQKILDTLIDTVLAGVLCGMLWFFIPLLAKRIKKNDESDKQ